MAFLKSAWLAPALRWFVLAALCLRAASPASAQAPAAREYQVKAVFLFNFAQFVDWPAAAFAAPDAPLVVGVLGEDPFGAMLDEAVRNEKVGSHPLEVRRYARLDDVGPCHILFVSRSEAARLDAVIAALRDRAVLTVSDADQAAVRGVMIRFVSENNRIRLRVNLDSTKRAGLTISSKLLRAAEVVGGQP